MADRNIHVKLSADVDPYVEAMERARLASLRRLSQHLDNPDEGDAEAVAV